MKRYFTAPKEDMGKFNVGGYHYIDNTDGTVTVVLINCNHPPKHWVEHPHLLNGGYENAKKFAAVHPMFEP